MRSILNKFIFYFLTSLFFFYANITFAECSIYNSDGNKTSPKEDPLYQILANQTACPFNIVEFKTLLEKSSLKSEVTMVANRGFHNPTLGSFSFFEIVHGNLADVNLTVNKGDFFFGHFTEAKDKKIVLDQNPSENKLMIELIVWDPKKQFYNFYELRGAGSATKWFYRGDSLDALKDNIYLYRDPPPNTAKFGNRMRCSACHNSGGPIMKELSSPHNDWWSSERPLPFAANHPDDDVAKQIKAVIEPLLLSESVSNGINQLEKSSSYQQVKNEISLQEQLRPLFCEVEINLQSDNVPLDETKTIMIPSGFFINSFLHEDSFLIDKKDYETYLKEFVINFPETKRRDADHAWLVPVKSISDIKAIQTVINKKIIDKTFAATVLSIDIDNPVFSQSRCELLKLIPQKFSSLWKDEFLIALQRSDLPQAKSLYLQLSNPKYSYEYYVTEAKKLAKTIQVRLKEPEGKKIYFKKMIDSRLAVAESEISKNPLGQILEPGFRVIFPESKTTQP